METNNQNNMGYTIVFRDFSHRTDKGLQFSFEEAKKYIEEKNGTDDKDFREHETGYVFVIDNNLKRIRYYEEIKPYPYNHYLSRVKKAERNFDSDFEVIKRYLNIEKTDRKDCYRISYNLNGDIVDTITYNTRAVDIINHDKEIDITYNSYAVDEAYLELFEELYIENMEVIESIIMGE